MASFFLSLSLSEAGGGIYKAKQPLPQIGSAAFFFGRPAHLEGLSRLVVISFYTHHPNLSSMPWLREINKDTFKHFIKGTLVKSLKIIVHV